MKYRLISKPVEAYQYTGHNAEELSETFVISRNGGLTMVQSKGWDTSLDPGDWLILDAHRSVTVVPDYAFKSRYEPAE